MTEDPAIPTLEVVGRRGQKTAPCEDLVTEARRILLDVAGGRVPEVEAKRARCLQRPQKLGIACGVVELLKP